MLESDLLAPLDSHISKPHAICMASNLLNLRMTQLPDVGQRNVERRPESCMRRQNHSGLIPVHLNPVLIEIMTNLLDVDGCLAIPRVKAYPQEKPPSVRGRRLV